MGVGIDVTGRCRALAADSERWFERARSWIEQHAGEPMESVRPGRAGDDHPAVLATLHPCAEDLEIAHLGAGRVRVRAKTSTVGPGYHAYLLDLLVRFGNDLAVVWETSEEGAGVVEIADRQTIEAEFLDWLGGVARVVREGLDRDYHWMMISMAIGHQYPHHGPLVTPMGPRGVDWLEAVAADPSRGIDLFPWWEPGLGAPFYLGRARARMWRDVRWRDPRAEDEGRLLMDVHLDLARAYRLDPALDYPWPEWAELIGPIESHFGYLEMSGDNLETEIHRRARAVGASVPRIGYRRRPVRVELTDGWSIEIPGEMAEEWDDEELWIARDEGRAVFFKSYSVTRDDGEAPPAAEILDGLTLPDGRAVDHREGPVTGRAVLTSPDGDEDPGWQLIGHHVVDGGLAACNIIFGEADDCDWAIATWRSLGHSSQVN